MPVYEAAPDPSTDSICSSQTDILYCCSGKCGAKLQPVGFLKLEQDQLVVFLVDVNKNNSVSYEKTVFPLRSGMSVCRDCGPSKCEDKVYWEGHEESCEYIWTKKMYGEQMKRDKKRITSTMR